MAGYEELLRRVVSVQREHSALERHLHNDSTSLGTSSIRDAWNQAPTQPQTPGPVSRPGPASTQGHTPGPAHSSQGQGHGLVNQGQGHPGQGHSSQSQSNTSQGHAGFIQGHASQNQTSQGHSYMTHTQGHTSQGQSHTREGQGHTSHGQCQTSQNQSHISQSQGQTSQSQGQTSQSQGHTSHGQGQTSQGQGQTSQGQGQTSHGGTSQGGEADFSFNDEILCREHLAQYEENSDLNDSQTPLEPVAGGNNSSRASESVAGGNNISRGQGRSAVTAQTAPPGGQARQNQDRELLELMQQFEQERGNLILQLEGEEKSRKWYYDQIEMLTGKIRSLPTATGHAAQTKQHLEFEVARLRDMMQESFGTNEEIGQRRDARILRIRQIEMEVAALHRHRQQFAQDELTNQHEASPLSPAHSSSGGEEFEPEQVTMATQTDEGQPAVKGGNCWPGGGIPAIYHGSWPIGQDERGQGQGGQGHDLASVMSFTSTNTSSSQGSRGAGGQGQGPPLSRQQQTQPVAMQPQAVPQQLGSKVPKVEMVYGLLSMLGTHDKDDMSRTLLAMSSSQDSCIAMRQSGCMPLLIQLLHGSDKDSALLGNTRGSKAARARASAALHNIVHSHPDDKRGRREARVLRLLEQIRAHCDQLRDAPSDEDEEGRDTGVQNGAMDHHPGPAIASLMKLSFDEEHRHAICTLGGLHAIAELLQVDQDVHGDTGEQYQVTMRRYACMALTNLTFGDGTNKALLCSMQPSMAALVAQLFSSNEDLCQVAASVVRNLSWKADLASKKTLREVRAVTSLMRAAMRVAKETTLKSILSALWNLSAHCSENKADICAVAGALEFLISSLTYKSPSKTTAIIENGGGILRNVSSHIAVREDYRKILRLHGCLQILLKHLRSPSLTIVSNACGTLWNLSARCGEDQQALWELGAVTMLRNLVHSKHKMISMGSSAALKNLLAARPNMPGLDLGGKPGPGGTSRPSLHARKQRHLEAELDAADLAETCDNVESPRDSPVEARKPDTGHFMYPAVYPGLTDGDSRRAPPRTGHLLPRSQSGDTGLGPDTGKPGVTERVSRSGSQDSVGSTHSDISHDRSRSCSTGKTPRTANMGGSLDRNKDSPATPHKKHNSDARTERNPLGAPNSRILQVMQEVAMHAGIEGQNQAECDSEVFKAPLPVAQYTRAQQQQQQQASQPGYHGNNSPGHMIGQQQQVGSIYQRYMISSARSVAPGNQELQQEQPGYHGNGGPPDDEEQPLDYSLKYRENSHSDGKPGAAAGISSPSKPGFYQQPGPDTARFPYNTAYAETDLDAPDQITDYSARYGAEYSTDQYTPTAPAQQYQGARYPGATPPSNNRYPGTDQQRNHSYGADTDPDCADCKLEELRRYNDRLEQTMGADQVRTFCTEDTPYLSNATSMTDLSTAVKILEEAEKSCPGEDSEHDYNGDEIQNYSSKYGETAPTHRHSPGHAHQGQRSPGHTQQGQRSPGQGQRSPGQSQGQRSEGDKSSRSGSQTTDPQTGTTVITNYNLANRDAIPADTCSVQDDSCAPEQSFHDNRNDDGPMDQMKTYCEEGTPLCFSRVSSLSSLHSSEAADRTDKPRGPLHSIRENELHSIRENELQNSRDKQNDAGSGFAGYSVGGRLNERQENQQGEGVGSSGMMKMGGAGAGEKEHKTVTFDARDQVQETPMMFSRCTSLGSLSSFDTQSVHSSVFSEYSRRASEVVSPSELPDSPSETMPPSPRRTKSPERFDHKKVVVRQELFPRTVETGSVKSEAPVVYADEGTPPLMDNMSQISAINSDTFSAINSDTFDMNDKTLVETADKTFVGSADKSGSHDQQDSTSRSSSVEKINKSEGTLSLDSIKLHVDKHDDSGTGLDCDDTAAQDDSLDLRQDQSQTTLQLGGASREATLATKGPVVCADEDETGNVSLSDVSEGEDDLLANVISSALPNNSKKIRKNTADSRRKLSNTSKTDNSRAGSSNKGDNSRANSSGKANNSRVSSSSKGDNSRGKPQEQVKCVSESPARPSSGIPLSCKGSSSKARRGSSGSAHSLNSGSGRGGPTPGDERAKSHIPLPQRHRDVSRVEAQTALNMSTDSGRSYTVEDDTPFNLSNTQSVIARSAAANTQTVVGRPATSRLESAGTRTVTGETDAAIIQKAKSLVQYEGDDSCRTYGDEECRTYATEDTPFSGSAPASPRNDRKFKGAGPPPDMNLDCITSFATEDTPFSGSAPGSPKLDGERRFPAGGDAETDSVTCFKTEDTPFSGSTLGSPKLEKRKNQEKATVAGKPGTEPTVSSDQSHAARSEQERQLCPARSEQERQLCRDQQQERQLCRDQQQDRQLCRDQQQRRQLPPAQRSGPPHLELDQDVMISYATEDTPLYQSNVPSPGLVQQKPAFPPSQVVGQCEAATRPVLHQTAMLSGQQTAMLPGQQTAMLPGQQTAMLPGQQTAMLLGQQTAILPGQQTAILPGQQTAMLPGQQTAMLPGQQTTMLPGRPLAGDYEGCEDRVKTFATEGTPLNYSRTGSFSDLSSIGTNLHSEAGVAMVTEVCDDAQSDNSSLQEESEELLSEIILAAMPSGGKHAAKTPDKNPAKTPASKHTAKSAKPSKANARTAGRSDERPRTAGNTGAQHGNTEAQHGKSGAKVMTEPSSSLGHEHYDQLKTYAVEGTPDNLSTATSLSNLTIDSMHGHGNTNNNRVHKQRVSGQGRTGAAGCEAEQGRDAVFLQSEFEGSNSLRVYQTEGTPQSFSCNESLSSLGIVEEETSNPVAQQIKALAQTITQSDTRAPALQNAPRPRQEDMGDRQQNVAAGSVDVAAAGSATQRDRSSSRLSDRSSQSGSLGRLLERHVTGESSEDQSVMADTPRSEAQDEMRDYGEEESPVCFNNEDVPGSGQHDEVRCYGVEDTPVCFSRTSSLSSIHDTPEHDREPSSSTQLHSASQHSGSTVQPSLPSQQQQLASDSRDDNRTVATSEDVTASREQTHNGSHHDNGRSASREQKWRHQVAASSFSRTSSLSSLSVHSDDDDDPEDIALLEDCISSALPPRTRPHTTRSHTRHSREERHSSDQRTEQAKTSRSASEVSGRERGSSGRGYHGDHSRNCASADELEDDGSHDSRLTNWRQQPHKSCEEIFRKPAFDARGRPCRRSRSQELKQYKDVSNQELAQSYRNTRPASQDQPPSARNLVTSTVATTEHDVQIHTQQIICESQNLTRSIESQVRELSRSTEEKCDEHESEKSPSSDQNFFMTCSGMTEISVETISKQSFPSSLLASSFAPDTDDDILDSSLLGSYPPDTDDPGRLSHERTMVGNTSQHSCDTTLTERGEVVTSQQPHTARTKMEASITSEDERALAENADLVLAEMTITRMGISASTVEDDRFIEYETLSLVSNDYISDTASEASVTWSASSERTSEMSDKTNTAPGSPAPTRRPRILKPGERSEVRSDAADLDSEGRGVRGKRKPLYSSKSVSAANKTSTPTRPDHQAKTRPTSVGSAAKTSPRSGPTPAAANKKAHTLRTMPQACSTPVKSAPSNKPRPGKAAVPQRIPSLDTNLTSNSPPRQANISNTAATKASSKSTKPSSTRGRSDGADSTDKPRILSKQNTDSTEKPRTLSKQGTFVKETSMRNAPVITCDPHNAPVSYRQQQLGDASHGGGNSSSDSSRSNTSDSLTTASSDNTDSSPHKNKADSSADRSIKRDNSADRSSLDTTRKDSKLRRSLGTSQLTNSRKSVGSTPTKIPSSKMSSPARSSLNKTASSSSLGKTSLKSGSGSSLAKSNSGSGLIKTGSNSSLKKLDMKQSDSNTSLKTSRPSTPVNTSNNRKQSAGSMTAAKNKKNNKKPANNNNNKVTSLLKKDPAGDGSKQKTPSKLPVAKSKHRVTDASTNSVTKRESSPRPTVNRNTVILSESSFDGMCRSSTYDKLNSTNETSQVPSHDSRHHSSNKSNCELDTTCRDWSRFEVGVEYNLDDAWATHVEQSIQVMSRSIEEKRCHGDPVAMGDVAGELSRLDLSDTPNKRLSKSGSMSEIEQYGVRINSGTWTKKRAANHSSLLPNAEDTSRTLPLKKRSESLNFTRLSSECLSSPYDDDYDETEVWIRRDDKMRCSESGISSKSKKKSYKGSSSFLPLKSVVSKVFGSKKTDKQSRSLIVTERDLQKHARKERDSKLNKSEMRASKAELKAEKAELKAEAKQQKAEQKALLKAEAKQLRAEQKALKRETRLSKSGRSSSVASNKDDSTVVATVTPPLHSSMSSLKKSADDLIDIDKSDDEVFDPHTYQTASLGRHKTYNVKSYHDNNSCHDNRLTRCVSVDQCDSDNRNKTLGVGGGAAVNVSPGNTTVTMATEESSMARSPPATGSNKSLHQSPTLQRHATKTEMLLARRQALLNSSSTTEKSDTEEESRRNKCIVTTV